MEAAAHIVPVPRLLAALADPPCFVMSFEAGEAAEPAHDEAPSGDDEVLVARRFEAASGLLARLHSVDVSGLVDDGTGSPYVSPADELGKWERTLGTIDGAFRAAGDRALASLTARLPEPAAPALVHGDYRLGNILFVGPDPTAIIDWEIWSIGDPRVDLGWYLTFCDPENFPGIGFPERRLPTAESAVRWYESASGRTVNELDWFLGLGAFKMGVVMANNLERHRSGRHIDPFQERLPRTIRRMLDRAASPDLTSRARR